MPNSEGMKAKRLPNTNLDSTSFSNSGCLDAATMSLALTSPDSYRAPKQSMGLVDLVDRLSCSSTLLISVPTWHAIAVAVPASTHTCDPRGCAYPSQIITAVAIASWSLLLLPPRHGHRCSMRT